MRNSDFMFDYVSVYVCVWWNELVVRPRFEQVNDNTFRFWCGVEWEEMFNNSRKKMGRQGEKKRVR